MGGFILSGTSTVSSVTKLPKRVFQFLGPPKGFPQTLKIFMHILSSQLIPMNYMISVIRKLVKPSNHVSLKESKLLTQEGQDMAPNVPVGFLKESSDMRLAG